MEIRMETLRAVVVYVSSSSRQYDWNTFCLIRGLKRQKFTRMQSMIFTIINPIPVVYLKKIGSFALFLWSF